MTTSEKETPTNSLMSSTEKGDSSDGSDSGDPKRQLWSSQMDFIMTSIGGCVGLGNIWRFPYLCYRNGGGAFLIPYFISFLILAAPLHIMEISLGQYTSTGCIGAWDLVPAFKGIGWCSAAILFYVNIYYVVVIAWALYYLFKSLTSELPWASCGNRWNSNRCYVTGMNLTETMSGCSNTSSAAVANCSSNVTSAEPRIDAVVEFWENNVLQKSSGIEEPGSLVPGITVALFVAWVIVYVCLFKGVKWTGKIVYFTATFPYVLLTVMLVRGVTLDGARDGIVFYVKPDFSRLADGTVWVEAASQVLYSCGAGMGFMMSLGSYNKYNTNTVRNGLLIVCVNCLTSIFGGFCVFSVLGFMAKELGQPIKNVVSSGPGLVFLAYPKAVTQLPLSPLWAALFFMLILFVGLDSQFVGVEGLTAPIMDMFPRVLYKPRNHKLFLAVYSVVSFLFGLLMVTQGGVYVFKFIDYYAVSGIVILITVLMQSVVIGWVFGADRFYDALELMIGRRVGPYLKICWKFLAPLVFVAILLYQLVMFKHLQFDAEYHYPGWVSGLGLLMIFSSVSCIPGVLAYRMVRGRGTIKQRWLQLLTPTLKKHQIHPRWHGSTYRWRSADYSSYDASNAYDVNFDIDTKI